jgi:transposase
VEPSPAEQAVIKAVRRARLFVFLRQHRHELFDEEFQSELAEAYVDSPKGQPPARLALATILQAYTKVSDDEVIEATVMDRRWQLVLDCMDAGEPPFAKGTLVAFRKRLIEKNLDRRLVERTVELAAATKGFGARALRAALDSSPLRGAGRVEDTFNLMGHALRKALGVIAVLQGRGQAAGTAVVAAQAGVPELAASSLKAALDRDWDDPGARDEALAGVLGLLETVEAFIAGQAGQEAAATAVAVARQVREQDVDLTGPAPELRRGVARDRRISIEDGQMRHGRKSRSVLFDGYKRHVLRDLDTGLVPVVGITPANVPEAAVTGDIEADLQAAGMSLAELHIDRAYLSSALVRDRGPDLAIFCKAWRVRNTGGRYAKDQFSLDFDTGRLTWPRRRGHAVRAWQDRPLPERHLRGLPAAAALHHQQQRAQRRDPPRRGAAGRTAPAPARPRRARQAARTRPGRARPGPRRTLAGPPRPLSGHPQEPVRPAPRRRRPQPPHHRPPDCHQRLPASRLTAT